MNTGAPFPSVDVAQERVLHFQRKLHEWDHHSMCSWRAGCGGSRTSGSEGGGEETTGRKADTGASPPTLYIPFDPHAANLMFALVSSRYERASMIVTSNKPFSRWGEIFGDDVVAAAMIDRLVHHAEILNLKGDSYRLKDKDLGSPPPAKSPEIG